jgi:dihydrofolate reductase|tara:strand:+ start:151 stop:666 length:516 start_codon:yes stop_codon:yes gene_type:complete
MNINIIVAYCKNNGIGVNNQLPWNIPGDLKRFSEITKGTGNNAIIMGRNTHESIGRILPRRFNIVLSTTQKIQGVETCESLESAIALCKCENFYNIFIIGGQSVYEEALNKKLVHKIYATEINKEYECDRFFPNVPEQYITHQENKVIDGIDVFYKTYEGTPLIDIPTYHG